MSNEHGGMIRFLAIAIGWIIWPFQLLGQALDWWDRRKGR